MGTSLLEISALKTPTYNSDIMIGKVLFIALFALVAATEAAKFARLQQKDTPVTYCSTTELLACVSEIEAAWNDCTGSADIMTCIQDILGASDCFKCICDVLGC